MPGPKLGRSGSGLPRRPVPLRVEALEGRNLPAATATLTGGLLSVVGDANRDVIRVSLDVAHNQLVVQSMVIEIGRFDSAAVNSILIIGGGGRDSITVAPNVFQPTTIIGGSGRDVIFGGGGPSTLLGGAGNDK